MHAAAAPLLLLDGDLRVVAASQGYLRAFVDADNPAGRPLEEITGGAWGVARVQALIEHVRRGDPIAAVDTCPEGSESCSPILRPAATAR
ncbi:MAG: hypothetical protein JWO83_3893 [Caulobacteraceae bacterium]|nr:hypothetical protein [Caulobacteraceae bacterium]